ncbi:hypothetical protein OH76DRAFT_1489539 [Lentinus brumalis]|uniref:Uncharacterized protein n=1 Tax=Lentinus brumalis TaxID=2498619 RepID=A0A371CM89_9APHY|nr:hypothetical protein OH76DRAFT_1489539 [Polyporus brumalis]
MPHAAPPSRTRSRPPASPGPPAHAPAYVPRASLPASPSSRPRRFDATPQVPDVVADSFPVPVYDADDNLVPSSPRRWRTGRVVGGEADAATDEEDNGEADNDELDAGAHRWIGSEQRLGAAEEGRGRRTGQTRHAQGLRTGPPSSLFGSAHACCWRGYGALASPPPSHACPEYRCDSAAAARW